VLIYVVIVHAVLIVKNIWQKKPIKINITRFIFQTLIFSNKDIKAACMKT